MKREQVLEKIQPLVEGQLRDVADGTRTKVNVTPDMITLRPTRGARLVEVAPEGAKNMVSFVGLPLGVAKMLTPGTFSQVLSELLSSTGKYSLILKEERVVNLVKYGERRPVNPQRLLDIIEKIIPVQDYNQVLTIPPAVASIEVVGEKTLPVVRGDLVRAGVKVDFSPMGTTNPFVQSYALRLSCTNGQTSNTVLAEFGHTGGEGDDVWQFFRYSIRRAYGSFNQVVSEWKKLVEQKIAPEDRALMLEYLIKRAKISGKAAEAIRAMAIERPPRNAWELQNLITYASSHLLETAQQVQRAQSVAADFADEERHARACPLCQRVR